jgi:hypothetical protein
MFWQKSWIFDKVAPTIIDVPNIGIASPGRGAVLRVADSSISKT